MTDETLSVIIEARAGEERRTVNAMRRLLRFALIAATVRVELHVSGRHIDTLLFKCRLLLA